MADTARYLLRAAAAKRELRNVEFKSRFDPTNDGEWLELSNDLVAIANIGGGVLIVGVENDGSPSGANVQPVLALDSATICDKLKAYLGDNFDDFEVSAVMRGGTQAAAIGVGGAKDAPLVFHRPGTYQVPHPGGSTEDRVFAWDLLSPWGRE